MDTSQFFAAVRPELVGDNGPSVRPGDDPLLYGSAVMTPCNPVEVRSFNTFEITYTVGRIGLDDTGGIRVCFRMISDFGKLQIPVRQTFSVQSVAVAAKSHYGLRPKVSGPGHWPSPHSSTAVT